MFNFQVLLSKILSSFHQIKFFKLHKVIEECDLFVRLSFISAIKELPFQNSTVWAIQVVTQKSSNLVTSTNPIEKGSKIQLGTIMGIDETRHSMVYICCWLCVCCCHRQCENSVTVGWFSEFHYCAFKAWIRGDFFLITPLFYHILVSLKFFSMCSFSNHTIYIFWKHESRCDIENVLLYWEYFSIGSVSFLHQAEFSSLEFF